MKYKVSYKVGELHCTRAVEADNMFEAFLLVLKENPQATLKESVPIARLVGEQPLAEVIHVDFKTKSVIKRVS